MTNPMNPTEIEKLEPAPVWRLFAGMAGVARPSKKEARIRAHVRAVAEERGFQVREDAAGNLLIEVPATAGCRSAPITVLQGHLDMVCEKNADTEHDFERDPIKLIVEKDALDGEWIVRADGTTLGADNGIGVALALAAASSPEVTHGPLELLLTVDEEAGMTGAKALQPRFFQGQRMLNLDSEADDVIYIGCAGGCDTTLTWEWPTGPVPKDAEWCAVSVAGLRGGHSGADIHLNRANAIKLLVQTLRGGPDAGLWLADFLGGRLRNAIPREASALVAGPPGTRESLTAAAKQVQAEAAREHGDESCVIRVEKRPAPDPSSGASPDDTQRWLRAMAALPHGVLAVVPDIPGLIQTSNNVATVMTERPAGSTVLRVKVGCLSRSSSAAQRKSVVRQIAAIGELAGAAVETGNEYPGWKPNLDSALLATCRRVYERLFEASPRVTAIHAGLECGLIGDRIGGMDMVSIGPRIEGAHSPDERVYIASVQKSWQFLTAILAELTGG